MLVSELINLGISDAHVDDNCYVTATLEANVKEEQNLPTIGLIAHMDTSPDVSGQNVKPQIIDNYNGGDIVVSPAHDIIIREAENPELKESIRTHNYNYRRNNTSWSR